ncbi:MAG: hypothetical protein LBG87_10345 [Spirochaetaceae bacterium]|jgi:hypothetical protein|nr:hypothetical protein [Spirochaetaceae bacterium]
MDDTKPEYRTKLTKADLDEASLDRDLVFHYSRERRLEKASPELRALNERGPQKRTSLLGSLTSTRSHTMMLISIVILGVAISFLAASKREKPGAKLGGSVISASAERLEGTTYLTIAKTVKPDGQKPAYTGAVDMVIQPAVSAAKDASPLESQPIASHRLFFTAKAKEEFGVSIPFEADSLVVIMQTQEDTHVIFKVRPK